MLYKHVSLSNTGRRGGQRRKWYRWSNNNSSWGEIPHRPNVYLIRTGINKMNVGMDIEYYSSFSSSEEEERIKRWRAFSIASAMSDEMEDLPPYHMLRRPGPHHLYLYQWGLYERDGEVKIPW